MLRMLAKGEKFAVKRTIVRVDLRSFQLVSLFSSVVPN